MPCTGSSASLALSDCTAWAAFYDATGGPHWTACRATRTDPRACNAKEIATVFVTAVGVHISGLHLGRNNLTGTIPAALGDLPGLGYVYLWENALHGPLPDSIAKLTKLRELQCERNALTGTIPSGLGQLSAMSIL